MTTVPSCLLNSKIRLRQGAVTELTKAESPSLLLLKATLHKLPDLERKLCSAYHKKVRTWGGGAEGRVGRSEHGEDGTEAGGEGEG